MAEGVLEIGDGNFEEEVLQSEKPVIIDFWAPWCGPCRAMTPIIEDIAKNFGDKVKVTKCNVDDNPITPGKYGVKAIPTLIFFKNGELFEQVTGMMAKPKVEEVLNRMIG